ncbi:MAG: HD domain-containing protein [Prevotella sp.]|nr:HD domain-containing protein [Prevotella sp.]
MDSLSIINEYYPSENDLRRILLTHSRSVADRCLLIARKHPELRLDTEFLEEAALLHDIGIYQCDAPGIQCFGTEPYICHGLIGGRLLREKGLVRHAQVCERHTGTGLSHEQIIAQQLPLPLDMIYEPDTLEEQVVCYADKFYSKTRLDLERTVEQTARSLEKFGEAGLQRFFHWVDLFE